MRRSPRGLGIFASALLATTTGNAARVVEDLAVSCSGTSLQATQIADSQPTRVRIAADARDAVLQLEENGRELTLQDSDDGESAALGARPPRLGIELRPVAADTTLTVRAAAETGQPAPLRWQLHCGASMRIRQLVDCTAAARIAEATGAVTARSPDDPVCAALVAHASATWSSRQGRYAEAIDRYARAIEQWRAAGDHPREAAALLGTAEQLRRSGRFQDALDAALQAEQLSRAAGAGYFAARATQDACLSLQALGRVDEARACLARLPDAFAALGETSEQANALYNIGSVAEEEGRLGDAERAAASALALDASRLSPLVTGRLHALSARLAIRNGNLHESVIALDMAAKAFERAGDARWQANNDLVAAEVMFALGDAGQARQLAEAANAKFAELQAPVRVAAAEVVLARIAQSRSDLVNASKLSRLAAERYRQSNMPLRALRAELVAVRAGDAAALQRVDAATSDQLVIPEGLQSERDLAIANFSWRNGDLPELRERLRALERARLDTWSAIDLLVAQSRYDMATGSADAALARLDAGIERLRTMGATLASASLRHVVGTRLGELRRAWVDAYLSALPAARPSVQRVWRMLASTQAAGLAAPASATTVERSEEADAFERAIAESLVALDADDATDAASSTSRQLLSYFSARESGSGTAPRLLEAPELDLVQRILRDDELLLALAIGDNGTLRLAATSNAASVAALAPASAVAVAVARLKHSLRAPSVPAGEVAEGARALGSLLFDGLEATPPLRLKVFGDDFVRIGPVAILHWPGTSAPLVESTAVSIVTAYAGTRRSAEKPTRVEVFASAGTAGAEPGLPPLFNADRESSWIAALTNLDAVDRTGSDFNRASLQAAFGMPHAWVHVAAHGMTRSGLLGQSGLVLPAATGGQKAGFISWLEIAESRIDAPLIVLNACDLAAQPNDSRVPESAFALALASAGAPNTVAAMWPVSDSAAAIWVPAFYGAMATDSDPAAAVREAQLRLRASRMYRHPYHWASLVHLSQLRD